MTTTTPDSRSNPDRQVLVYQAKDGWRWRRVVKANGKKVADSGEAYTRKSDARDAASMENPGVEVVVLVD